MTNKQLKVTSVPQNYYEYLDSLKNSNLLDKNLDFQEEVIHIVKEEKFLIEEDHANK